MNDKIMFEEIIQTAALESVNRDINSFPVEVLMPTSPSEKEQFLMDKLFDADSDEEQIRLLKELIHCSVETMEKYDD